MTDVAHDVQESPVAPPTPDQAKVEPEATAVKELELLRHTVADADGRMLSTGKALTETAVFA
jgi:hypothetical protein